MGDSAGWDTSWNAVATEIYDAGRTRRAAKLLLVDFCLAHRHGVDGAG